MQEKVKNFESGQHQKAQKKPPPKETLPAAPPAEVLREAVVALETLKQLKATADTCAKTESEDSWSALMRQAKACQAKLRLCCEELSKGDVLAELAARATRQRKKRERLRRQRLEKEQEAEEVAKHVALVEARINAQRQRIIDKANQDRQEAEMKDEADSILSEIRFKINRTREYLDRLCAMEQLRAARKESYQQKGLYVAPEADANFDTEVSSVRSLLESQLSDYLKEETALKVMLETEQKEQYESKKLAAKQAAVLAGLFGEQGTPFYEMTATFDCYNSSTALTAQLTAVVDSF